MGVDVSTLEREVDAARREIAGLKTTLTTERQEREKKDMERRLREAEERLLNGRVPPEIRPTQEELQRFRDKYHYQRPGLNIAVTGDSGVGKSTLLNVLRGLNDGEDGAAAVGVNETTSTIEGFVDPNHPNVKWYDIPGANTMNGWMYFTTQHLYIFDKIIILFSGRFTETVGTILQNARQCGIPTYLVRTKADLLLHNIQRKDKKLDRMGAVKLLVQNTEDTVHDNLVKLEIPFRPPVYNVSEDGMRQWVRQGDDSNVINEKDLYEAILPGYMKDKKQDGNGADAQIWWYVVI